MIDRIAASLARLLLHRHALAVLFVLYLLPRAAMIACNVTPTSDADWYYSRAAMLSHGLGYLDAKGHATAFWPVGWPWLLSLAFRVGGVSVWTVGAINLIAAMATAWLTLDLGRRMTGSELAARTALLALAVYPNAILYVPLALTEVVYTALLLLAVWLLVARPGWLATLGAGLVFGLATLVKAQTLVIVPVIFAIVLWRDGGVWRRCPGVVARGALVLAAAALVIAPWTFRNHRELGAWVTVSTNGGFTLLTGNNDSARGGYTPDDVLVRQLNAQTSLDEVAYDAEARRLGTHWIATHPGQFVKLIPLKLWHLWGPDGEGQWAYETGSRAFTAAPHAFLAVRAVNQLWYWLLLVAFAVAPFHLIRARMAAGQGVIDWWLIAYAVALFPTAIAVVFSGQSRFHYPVMPFVCIIAGWLVADWCARRRRTNT
ncbi:glycosyltransferase family 39 protein [Novosphingobium sp.]|uniref:glycosyltransferase family 39 protein n=1 Tax=Novosphingobium sp. TaxID=1874826 RepID=UPI00334266E6